MQNKKALFSLLSVATLLAIVWVFWMISESLLKEKSSENNNYIPKDATYTFVLDGKKVAEKALFSLLVEAKDAEILNLIQTTILQKSKVDGEMKNYGIDYLSDIVFFEMPYNNTAVKGVLVNLSNGILFRKNMAKSKNSFAVKKDVGVVLFPSEKNDLPNNLNKFAAKILSEMQPKSNLQQKNGDRKLIETSSFGSVFGMNSFFNKSNIGIDIQNTSLYISGALSKNEKAKEQPKTVGTIVQPSGLHISTSLVPALLSDTLNFFLKQFNTSFPVISEVSLNYYGTKIVNHSSGFYVLPQMELLVTCSSNVEIEKILENAEIQSYLGYKLVGNSMRFQSEKLYFKQVTATSFYIGRIENPTFEKGNTSYYLNMNGSLKPLISIEGGGMMLAFLEMLPIFRASKNLAEHTEFVQIKLSKKGNKIANLEGEMRFKKTYYPMTELTRFLLIGQLLD
jgi:hypothetical protein